VEKPTDGIPPLSMVEVLRYRLILATLPQLKPLKEPPPCRR
jgi:hypothetical protein